MTVEPFQPEHLESLRVRLSQSHISEALYSESYIRGLAASNSWTAKQDGEVIACAGLIEAWPGHYQAWALLASDIGGQGMLQCTRAIRRMLAAQDGRIETFVAADFEQGHRWMDVLGFERETPGVMRKWFPDGSPAVLYARVT